MNLLKMAKEIEKVSREKGWYDNPVSFPTAMALLHSEVSEALDAYWKWGLNDRTDQTYPYGSQPDPDYAPFLPKPEGVGSEFADILIRLLDCVNRFDPEGYFYGTQTPGPFSIQHLEYLFPENLNTMHDIISRASALYTISRNNIPYQFSVLYSYLLTLCKEFGINLEAEVERKMKYNETRPGSQPATPPYKPDKDLIGYVERGRSDPCKLVRSRLRKVPARATGVNASAIEDALRSYPAFAGYSNELYGLDDLDFQDFISGLARYIQERLEH